MKVELHLHTTRYSGCAINTPEEMMIRLVEAGYDAVFITEHSEVWCDEEIDDLQAEFPFVRVFTGMELSFGEQHLLVLGSNDPAYLRMDSEADVLARAAQDGCLTVLAHPYRYTGGAAMLEYDLRPDALELFTNNHAPQNAERARATAEYLGLRLVNAGDSHSVEALDRFWIETARPLVHRGDLREIILAGEYENRANV